MACPVCGTPGVTRSEDCPACKGHRSIRYKLALMDSRKTFRSALLMVFLCLLFAGGSAEVRASTPERVPQFIPVLAAEEFQSDEMATLLVVFLIALGLWKMRQVIWSICLFGGAILFFFLWISTKEGFSEGIKQGSPEAGTALTFFVAIVAAWKWMKSGKQS